LFSQNFACTQNSTAKIWVTSRGGTFRGLHYMISIHENELSERPGTS
jgi:hypothetical protein